MNKYIGAISTNLVFFIINTLFFLIMTPISIRVMGVDFYGLLSILYAIALFLNVGTLGIGSIVNKFSAESNNLSIDYSAKVLTSGFLIVLMMSILTSLLMFLARALIAGNIKTTSNLQRDFYYALFWIILSIFPQFLAKVPQGFFLSRYENILARSMDSLISMLPWIGAICIALVQKNLVKVAEWFFFVQWIVFLIYFVILVRKVSYHLYFDGILLRKMLNFSGFMFINSVAITFFQQFDRVIVGFVLGPAIAGVYSVGTSVGLRIPLIAGQVTELMIPYASLKDFQDERERLFIVFRKLSQYVSLTVAGIGGFLILWMDKILSLWISPSYALNYSNPFRILVIAYGLISLSRPADQTLTGLGKVKFTSLVYLFSSVAMLSGVYVFSLHFGLFGAACADCIMVILLVFNLYTYHNLSKKISWMAVINDLQWGFFLPIIIYILLFIAQTIIFKLLLTAILGITLIMVIRKDDWIRAWFWQQARRIVHI
jgi:polysaccharide transporter, PST family